MSLGRRSASSSDSRQQVCPRCVLPVNRFDHLCPHCGGQVTAHAAIDPLLTVYAEGRLYQNATTYPPTRLALSGMWVIFGSSLVINIFAITEWLLLKRVNEPHDFVIEGDAEAFEIEVYEWLPIGLVSLNDLDFLLFSLIAVISGAISVIVLWKTTRLFFRPALSGSMLPDRAIQAIEDL